jgi:replication factor A1
MTLVDTQQAKNLRSGVDINGQITQISDSRTVNLKAGGTTTVADATLSDDAGDIQLSLWGDDSKGIKIGSKVSIINGYTNTFKDQVSLTKGKFGQLLLVE